MTFLRKPNGPSIKHREPSIQLTPHDVVDTDTIGPTFVNNRQEAFKRHYYKPDSRLEEIAPPRPSPSESRPASSSHLESSEYEDAVSEDESTEDASSFLRLGTILEALAEYLVPRSVQQASPTDWAVGLCMVAVLSHAAIFRFLPGVLQEVAALREGLSYAGPKGVDVLGNTDAASVVAGEQEVIVDGTQEVEACGDLEAEGVVQCQGAGCATVEGQPLSAAVAAAEPQETVEGSNTLQDSFAAGTTSTARINEAVSPAAPASVAEADAVDTGGDGDAATRSWLTSPIQASPAAASPALPSACGLHTRNETLSERPEACSAYQAPYFASRDTWVSLTNIKGLANWLLKPSDDSKGLPLAEKKYFTSGAHVVNGALEKVVFPLLIAFPLCATAVIMAAALFSGTPSCSKMTFWVQGDVKQAINRAIKQGPAYYTIDRKGPELKDEAVQLTESFFALNLPFDSINAEEHRDLVQFVAAYAFFALVREGDARIRSSFRDRPEMTRVHESAARAMVADPRWPELENLVLDMEPSHLRS